MDSCSVQQKSTSENDYIYNLFCPLTGEKQLPPVPLLLVLSTEGLLCPFYVVNMELTEDITTKPIPLPAGERVATGQFDVSILTLSYFENICRAVLCFKLYTLFKDILLSDCLKLLQCLEHIARCVVCFGLVKFGWVGWGLVGFGVGVFVCLFVLHKTILTQALYFFCDDYVEKCNICRFHF